MNIKGRRLGRFIVAAAFFESLNPGDGVNLFHGMVVLDVRRDWMRNDREYFAMHPDFEPCPEGQIVPEYVAVFSGTSSLPRWELRHG